MMRGGRGAREEEGSAYGTALHYIWQKRVRIEERGAEQPRQGKGRRGERGCR